MTRYRCNDLAELSYANPIVMPAVVCKTNENISSRKKVVYKTLIKPTIARLEAEKNKHKFFLGVLFKLNNPEEIEWVSTEKYYEPFLTAKGKYFIDYYRKCEYTVRVDKEVSEVILFNNTFMPKHSNYLKFEQNIKLQGEERLVKNKNAFLFLNKDGKKLRIKDFSPAPSEENPEELIKSLNMPEVPSSIDIEAMKGSILKRPNDISRLVAESLEIAERWVVYRPIYKVTFKCARLSKIACFEIDGITSKIVRSENRLVAAAKAMLAVFQ